MLETYQAKLLGDHIVWDGESPQMIQTEKEVDVLITLLEPKTRTDVRRPSGLAAGEFVVPDDFDEPLPDSVIASFEN